MTTEAKTPTGAGSEQAKAEERKIMWAEIEARAEAQRAAARREMCDERAALLEELRAAGVIRIEAQYDGYGDSGNVSDIIETPREVDVRCLMVRLTDFFWQVACDLHPGFENNDGGEGTITWDMASDRINVDHADFYTAREEYRHEDV